MCYERTLPEGFATNSKRNPSKPERRASNMDDMQPSTLYITVLDVAWCGLHIPILCTSIATPVSCCHMNTVQAQIWVQDGFPEPNL